MGEVQPVHELAGGFCRRVAIEGHKGRRTAGHPHEISAPPIRAYEKNFNLVRLAVDGFFEAMRGHGVEAGGDRLKNIGTEKLYRF